MKPYFVNFKEFERKFIKIDFNFITSVEILDLIGIKIIF